MKFMERISEFGIEMKNKAVAWIAAVKERLPQKTAVKADAGGQEMEDAAVQPADIQKTVAEEPEEKPKSVIGKILGVFGAIFTWIYRLRAVFMAAPVVYAALRLAAVNMERLPEQVGLNLQATGEFAQMIDRDLAVYGPLGITAACLLMMFCSRRAFYPWIISIFTLVVPLMLWLTNVYPQ